MKILKRIFWLILLISVFFAIPIAVAIWGMKFTFGAFDYIIEKLK